MRKKIIGAVVAMCLTVGGGTQLFAQDYEHEVKVKDMSFSWTIEETALKVKVSGKTSGWVGIGFNPSAQMKDGNFILGYVKDGKASIVDHFGDGDTSHEDDEKLGGSSDITVIGGTEDKTSTAIEFSMPLNSGDKKDNLIDPAGETVVLLAYGGSRDSFKSKHQFRTTIKVNLSDGKVL